MSVYLLLTAIIILSCVLFNKLSSKLGVPMLFAFIALGMFFGSDGIVKIEFENYEFAEWICSTALIVIMFYGGFGTNWDEARPVAVKAMLLSTIGVVLTAGLTAAFCYLIVGINFYESLLIGAVISSTDAASVFSILRSKKLNLKYNTASMLEVESGSNDPSSYMMTAIVLTIMKENLSGGSIAYMIFSQITYGIVIGLVIAFISLMILRKFKFATDGFDAIFVLAIAIISYAVPTLIGGNGYLSTYIVGIILGNNKIRNKQALVHFFDGLTGLTQMLIFFLLGLLAFPSQIPPIMLPAIVISLFLIFVVRPIAVFAILTPFKSNFKQQLLVSWTGLRGAASIVFAIMVKSSGSTTDNDIFHIVFFIVLISIAIQGTFVPLVAKKLDMIDDNENVLKTFSDYSDETPIEFIKLVISDKNPWVNKQLKDIDIPLGTLLVLVLRNNQRIVPNGDTYICENDVIVLSALSYMGEAHIEITEIEIGKNSKWNGKRISDMPNDPDSLIIMIKRGEKTIIPNGDSLIMEKDILVMSK